MHLRTLHGQVLQLLKYIKRGKGWGKGSGSQSSKEQELRRVTRPRAKGANDEEQEELRLGARRAIDQEQES